MTGGLPEQLLVLFFLHTPPTGFLLVILVVVLTALAIVARGIFLLAARRAGRKTLIRAVLWQALIGGVVTAFAIANKGWLSVADLLYCFGAPFGFFPASILEVVTTGRPGSGSLIVGTLGIIFNYFGSLTLADFVEWLKNKVSNQKLSLP